jgi:uncharacterized protein YjbJ (UPF0337 family)
MNDNEVKGNAREIKGKVEKEVGNVTGNERIQAHGEAEEVKGKVQKEAGHVQSKAKNVKHDVTNTIDRATK